MGDGWENLPHQSAGGKTGARDKSVYGTAGEKGKMKKLQVVKDGFYFLRDGKVVREVRRIRTPVKGTNGEECKLSLWVSVEKLKRNLKRYKRAVKRNLRAYKGEKK